MGSQAFKTVYFSDHPAENARSRNLKLAFGEQDSGLYDEIARFSSCEVRALLGGESFQTLRQEASNAGLPLNTYCLQILRRWHCARQSRVDQLTLPGIQPDLGLHSTFRSGKEGALQRWYPWLEGYSPDFVRHILNNFAPNANRVLDPFAGSGTTPITVATLGKQAFYCELNPMLQFLVETKTRVLLLPRRERIRLAGMLRRLRDSLDQQIASSGPDRYLRDAYAACFGARNSFDTGTLDQVLRTRQLLDRLACDDVLFAQLVTVAVIASLIPASHLKRAGDLRFRRESEREQIEPFGTGVQRRLEMIAEDLTRADQADLAPVMVASDARTLQLIPPLMCDAVVTSPPYLNGTNYFRNTKIELWFLRCLRTPADLAAFRLQAVTAGINDVTRRKQVSSNIAVQDAMRTLDEAAYDLRIPQMVGSYFYDMEQILNGLRRHMQPGSLLALDIGDSTYAGQHVATDMLLKGIAEDLGFKHEDTVVLRNRVSRDGTRLKQALLVFQYGPKTTYKVKSQRRTVKERRPSWAKAWSLLKSELPHQKDPYARRNWGHPLHSLCSYQGKMKPALAHFLVQTFVPRGGQVLDPFAGVGTIPFEAALQGSKSFGFEISPAALAIATAKVAASEAHHTHHVIESLDSYIRTHTITEAERTRTAEIRFNNSVDSYFHPETLAEVLLARRFYQENPARTPSETLVFASLLHILHGNRPYSLSRRSHPITPFAPSGEVEYRALIPRLREKVTRSLAAQLPEGFVIGAVYECDATNWWPQGVNDLDAIVTSPPFFDSTRFYLANWMRLWFAGWERADFASRPRAFVDERQKQSFKVYEAIFRQARERLKPDGVIVLHLGESRKCDMAAQIRTVASPWFGVADVFRENVEHCESHGIRDKGTVTSHQFLVLK